jgi:hypothetical protein
MAIIEAGTSRKWSAKELNDLAGGLQIGVSVAVIADLWRDMRKRFGRRPSSWDYFRSRRWSKRPSTKDRRNKASQHCGALVLAGFARLGAGSRRRLAFKAREDYLQECNLSPQNGDLGLGDIHTAPL